MVRHHYFTVGGNHYYRPVWVRDPWDNETKYFYDSTSHRLIRIESPSGVHKEYAYTTGTGQELWVSITYKKGGTVDTSLSRGYKFDTLGRLDYSWRPKTPMVVGPSGAGSLPGSNQLYSTPSPGTQPTSYWRIEKYEYYQPFDLPVLQDWYPRKVFEGFSTQVDSTTQLPVPPASLTKIAEWQYGKTGSRYRVTKYIDRHGAAHNFQYVEDTSGTVYVKETTFIDPRNTKRKYTRDNLLRITKLTVTPENSAQGRPRAHEGGQGQYPEPASLTWLYEYGSGSCSCGRPTKITEPSGDITEYTWDPNTGLMLSLKEMNPSGGASQTWQFEYTDSWYNTVQRQALIKKVTRPDGKTWEYSYVLSSATRQDPKHGNKITLFQIKSPQVAGSNIIVTTKLDGNGRVTSVNDPENTGTETTFTYVGWYLDKMTRGVGSGSGTRITDYDYDDYGRLLSLKDNVGSTALTHTTFVRGPEGQMLEASTPRGSVTQRTVVYYDVWDNPAVVCRLNKDSSGSTQKDHGATSSSAREWTRTELHYLDDRLIREFDDRRPLYDPADSSPVSGSNPWMKRWTYTHYLDGDLHTVESPNGTIREITKDGYGTIYKAVDTHGSQSNEVGRYYINSDLEVVRATTSVGDTVLERNPAGYVTAVVEPELATVPQGYDPNAGRGGARHEFGYDIFGRLTSELTRNGKTGSDPVIASTSIGRDGLGRVTSVAEQIIGAATGTRTETYSYNKRSQVTQITRPANRNIQFVYDNRGRLTKTNDLQNPDDNKVEYVYNAGSDLVQFIKRFEERETHGGSSSTVNYWTEIVHGLGAVVTKYRDKGQSGTVSARDLNIHVNSLGDVDRVVDAAGKDIRMYYDALGRQLAVARIGQPADILTRTHFDDAQDASGNTFVRRVDPRSLVTKLTYDYLGRQTIIQRPGANLSSPPSPSVPHKSHSLLIQYDAAHRPISISDGQGVTINQIFDPLDRLLVRESPNVHQAGFVSQFVTREVFNRNRLGQIKTDYTFRGALGPSMTIVTFTGRSWDSLGRVHNESFLYDGAPLALSSIVSGFNATNDPDFRTDLTYSNGLALKYTPDNIGRIKTIAAKLVGQSNYSTLATYRHTGALVNERELHYGTAVGKTTFAFDNYGRGTQIKDVTGSTTLAQFDFEYDVVNNLISEKYTRPSTGHVGGGDRFVYDDFNRVSQAWLGLDAASMTGTLDDNNSTYKERFIYSLDPAGNRTSVQKAEKQGSTVNYSTRTYFNNPVSNRYDASSPGFGDPGIQSYLYDDRGNTIFDGRFYYVYDYNNRLAEVYSLDPCGGAQSQSSSSSSSSTSKTSSTSRSAPKFKATASQLAAARHKILSAQRYDYGKIIRYRDQLHKNGKLKASLTTSSSSKSSSSSSTQSSSTLYLNALYGYDVYDRRTIRLIICEGTFYHTYDGWREAEELEVKSISGQNQLVARKAFTWGHRLDEMLSYVKRVDQGGSVSYTSYFAHQAGGDATSMLVSSDGSKVEDYEYDAYGRPSVYVSGSYMGSVSTVGNPYSWHGKRFDSLTGLFYSRYRYYSSDFGRFLNVDPTGIWADALNAGNGYAFGADNPLSWTDPYGLQGRPIMRAPLSSKTVGLIRYIEVAAKNLPSPPSGHYIESELFFPEPIYQRGAQPPIIGVWLTKTAAGISGGPLLDVSAKAAAVSAAKTVARVGVPGGKTAVKGAITLAGR